MRDTGPNPLFMDPVREGIAEATGRLGRRRPAGSAGARPRSVIWRR
jgi:hypothetical protein